jgi:D-alanyl-D-alanine carboxypeptidase
VLLHPGLPTPAEDWLELTVEDGATLRQEAAAGFGSPGETVEYTWGPDGTATEVRFGGLTAWPVDAFLARRAEQVAAVPR